MDALGNYGTAESLSYAIFLQLTSHMFFSSKHLYSECLQAVWSMMNGTITGWLGNWNLLRLWSLQRTLLLSLILRAREGNSTSCPN